MKMEGQDFYNWLQAIPAYKKALEEINEELILEIQETINSKYNFRPYQKQAMMAFDWMINCVKKEDSIISQLIDPKLGNFPILGLESATGSGKTLLIGAFITYLHLKHNIKNFLILTPPRGKSAIYDKTIRNFDINDKSCVLSNNFNKKYNLVTGDNYTDKSSNYEEDADFNIYVFNINKFFESSSGIKSVDKPWEEGFWKDTNDNIISFRDYLSQLKDLVIITDEAHHFQKYSQTSGDIVDSGRGNTAGDIVIDLKPKFLIEFTATMVAEQKPIYRYSVNDYISDGYGKKIRAWGINTNSEKGLFEYDTDVIEKNKQVTDSDASKIVRAVAVHLIKRKALEYDREKPKSIKKPILLIKARNTDHADNILKYIQEEIPLKDDAIRQIYEQIIRDNDYEINKLIEQYIPSKDILLKELEELSDLSFSFHTNNETKESLELFNNLEDNKMEVLIQVDKATEGWNIDNVYTILILSNNEGEIKTNVKQLIGRGLRLLREKRIYDETEDKLKQEEELLHVICEQGNNFAKFVEDIRKEIGLNSENFRTNIKIIPKLNKTTIQDILKYNDLRVPRIERDSEPNIDSPEELIRKLNFKDLELETFAKSVSTPWNNKKGNGMILKWNEDDQTKEADLISGMILKESTSEYTSEEELILSEIQRTKIIKEIIKNQNILPSNEEVDDAIRESIRELTDKYSFYFRKKYGKNDMWSRKFSNDLINYISKKIDMYFDAKTIIEKYDLFKDVFQEFFINVEYSNGEPGNLKTKEQIHNVMNSNKKEIPKSWVYGYIKSYFTYNQFDSSQEVKFAELLDKSEQVELWVKNKRSGQLIMRYGLGKGFNPDFIVKLKNSNELYIVEIKSEGLKDVSKEKIEVMIDANKVSEDKFKCYFYWNTTIDDIYKNQITDFIRILERDDLNNIL
jgi:type III restriction enzyme